MASYDFTNNEVSDDITTPIYKITVNKNSNFSKTKSVRTFAKCYLNSNSIILGMAGLAVIMTAGYIYIYPEIHLQQYFNILVTIGTCILGFSILTCISVTRFGKTCGCCTVPDVFIISVFTIVNTIIAIVSFMIVIIYGVYLNMYYTNSTTPDILNIPKEYIQNISHEIYDFCCYQNNTNKIDFPCIRILDMNTTAYCKSYSSFYKVFVEFLVHISKLTIGITSSIGILTTISSIMACVLCKKYRRIVYYTYKNTDDYIET